MKDTIMFKVNDIVKIKPFAPAGQRVVKGKILNIFPELNYPFIVMFIENKAGDKLNNPDGYCYYKEDELEECNVQLLFDFMKG